MSDLTNALKLLAMEEHARTAPITALLLEAVSALETVENLTDVFEVHEALKKLREVVK